MGDGGGDAVGGVVMALMTVLGSERDGSYRNNGWYVHGERNEGSLATKPHAPMIFFVCEEERTRGKSANACASTKCRIG